jgi:hypothetical protein
MAAARRNSQTGRVNAGNSQVLGVKAVCFRPTAYSQRMRYQSACAINESNPAAKMMACLRSTPNALCCAVGHGRCRLFCSPQGPNWGARLTLRLTRRAFDQSAGAIPAHLPPCPRPPCSLQNLLPSSCEICNRDTPPKPLAQPAAPPQIVMCAQRPHSQ